ncbi:Cupredoxin [Mycena leptocephala]|nr:Cupredoxin [Mycena leptocephala]
MYQGFANGTNSAILRYAGAPKVEPIARDSPSKYPLVETALHPLVPTKVPGKHVAGGADVNLRLNISFNGTIGRRSSRQRYRCCCRFSRAHTGAGAAPEGAVYELPPNKVIEISIQHPFHLHGVRIFILYPAIMVHNFHVVRSAGSPEYNYENPVIRDVVATGNSTDDLTTFRILHCHIDWHLSIGLAVVLAENIPGIQAQEKPPYSWDQLCRINNSTAQPL